MASPEAPQDSQTLLLPDGRTLGYAVYGSPPSPTTPTFFYFHGFPGSRFEGRIFLDSSLAPKITARCICPDRPGHGLSTLQQPRRVLDYPADILALADHLQIDQFYVLGASGGAPYALACAKEIPRSRLLGTAVVSGAYPGSRKGSLFALRALLFAGYWAPTALMAKALDSMFGKAARDPDPKVMEDLFDKEMKGRPGPDLKCLENKELKAVVVKSMSGAFVGGGMGPAWDLRLVSDWGFGLEEVDGRDVTLWHGKADVNCPVSMAEEAGKLIKGCELKVFEEETHMSLPFNHVEEILRGLLRL